MSDQSYVTSVDAVARYNAAVRDLGQAALARQGIYLPGRLALSLDLAVSQYVEAWKVMTGYKPAQEGEHDA